MKLRNKLKTALLIGAVSLAAPASAGNLVTHSGHKIVFGSSGHHYKAKRHHSKPHFILRKSRHGHYGFRKHHRSFKHGRGHAFRGSKFRHKFR